MKLSLAFLLRHTSLGETALLGERNGTSLPEKCHFMKIIHLAPFGRWRECEKIKKMMFDEKKVGNCGAKWRKMIIFAAKTIII